MLDFNDRLFKTKCYHCGSTSKRMITIKGSMNQKLGFILVCCKCGNINTFTKDDKALRDIINNNYRLSEPQCVKVGDKCEIKPCSYNKYLGDEKDPNNKITINPGSTKPDELNYCSIDNKTNYTMNQQSLFKMVTDSVYGEINKDVTLKEGDNKK